MARKDYKVSEEIKVTYQAPGAATGLTVTMEIYDETGAKDGVNFPDVTMTEIGSSGRYQASFTPDALGEWVIQISDTNGGKVVKQYSVGGYNLDGIGTAVDGLNDVSTAEVNTEVDTALSDYDGPTKAELDSAESNIRGADSDTLKSLSDQIDGLESPPMIG